MQSDLCFKRLTLVAGLRINQKEKRAEARKPLRTLLK